MRHLTTAVFALAAAAGLASAGLPSESFTFTIDSGALDLDSTVRTFVGSDTDAASTEDVTGGFQVVRFSDGKGEFFALEGMDIAIDPPVTVEGAVDAGDFLGQADPVGMTINGMTIFGEFGPEAGLGSTTDVYVMLSGEAYASYDLVGIEPAEGRTIDLATLDPFPAQFIVDTFEEDEGVFTASLTVFFGESAVIFEPGLVEILVDETSTLTVNATGSSDAPEYCSILDIAEPCGLIDLNDLNAFIAGFQSNSEPADLNDNGLVELDDLTLLITTWNQDFGVACQEPGGYDCYAYYAGINFDEGDAAYALGDHTYLTAGLAVSGAALMLGFGSFRRKQA